jgi:hypothetical protein
MRKLEMMLENFLISRIDLIELFEIVFDEPANRPDSKEQGTLIIDNVIFH